MFNKHYILYLWYLSYMKDSNGFDSYGNSYDKNESGMLNLKVHTLVITDRNV